MGTHKTMMRWRMMLGEVVGHVVDTASPMNDKLALFDSILDPIKAHIHGFGATLLDSIVHDASGAGVVRLNERWWLFMAHINIT